MAEQIYDIKGALNSGSQFTEDPELEAIKVRVMEMEEEEEEKLREAQYCSDKPYTYGPLQTGLFYSMTPEERIDADSRSVYVGNVDYGTTADELEIYFNGCGHVNRVTILCDKFTGHPKGFAYIEFSDRESVRMAMALDETLFRGRILKVLPKRTNMPGISSTDRGFARGGRFRGRGVRASRFHNGLQGRFRGFIRGSGRAQPWYISY
ncbi:embryonic polyadenylate-binding protein 2 [Tachysurus fulvidraco]|uniref:embryonic polyadenylate-binding protein 2 n=1 Tax=Tachysurus fulvidraco TaxID=1234273 RepID=UPI000F4F2A5A|nr:embryonic polyadenylate-binding protein 2 [Tachysurus fulvidraco]